MAADALLLPGQFRARALRRMDGREIPWQRAFDRAWGLPGDCRLGHWGLAHGRRLRAQNQRVNFDEVARATSAIGRNESGGANVGDPFEGL